MREKQKLILWAAAAAVGVFLVIYYWDAVSGLLGLMLGAISPLISGMIIAYAVNIIMSGYERWYFPKSTSAWVVKSRRPVCLAAAFLTILVALALVVYLVLPELVACIKLLLAEVPDALSGLLAMIPGDKDLLTPILDWLEGIDWKSILTSLAQGLVSGIEGVIGVATGLVGVVVDVVLALIFSLYLLSGRDKLLAQVRRLTKTYMRPSWYEKLTYTLGVFNTSFRKFIVGQATEAVILGVLCCLGMLLFRFPYAVMTGVIVGVTALVPIAGAYIGGAVGLLLILTVDPIKALLFVVYLVVLQQMEGNLIYPRVVGSSMGLPGIWVLAAVTVGGGVAGIPGMLLGVPLAAAIYQLLRQDIRKRSAQTSLEEVPPEDSPQA